MLSTSYNNVDTRTEPVLAPAPVRWSQPYTQHDHGVRHLSSRPNIHAVGQPCNKDVNGACVAHARSLRDLEVSYDAKQRILWQFMNPRERACFTPELIDEISRTLTLAEDLSREADTSGDPAIDYLVLSSRVPGIFNLGGHLPLFMRLIEDQNKEALRAYAHSCVNEQYRWAINLDLPICTIAVVQGDALGGGFEAALAHDLIIAERSANFGLPEVLFNLFPGMGAYTFLSRKLDSARAEKMILSGKVYSADELYEMGVVNRVVDDGKGVEAVHDLIREQERTAQTWRAVFRARQIVNPVTRQEMMDITDMWVDMAMNLAPKDLRRMRHLAVAQDRRWAKIRSAA